MLLYHGTSELHLEKILKKGITPRSHRKDRIGNWKHTITSNSKAVYLTNAYGVFYAQSALNKKERLVVIEINSDLLLPWKFTPDEDCLEQTSRKQSIVEDNNGSVCTSEMTMKQRTRWFRQRLLQF